MFEWFQPHSSTEMILQWKWAAAHPYLYTIIRISQPYLIAVVVLVGAKAVSTWKGGRR